MQTLLLKQVFEALEKIIKENQAKKSRNIGFKKVIITELQSPEHNNIISIFSDTEYMQNLYNQLLFIREMTRKEVLQN